jgi:type IV pilus assembly protein PilN
MIRINLLPHREEKRLAQKRQMGVIAGGVAILGVLTILLGYTAIAGMIEYQKGNNSYLKSEIAKLNDQIQEIKTERKDQRLARAEKGGRRSASQPF